MRLIVKIIITMVFVVSVSFSQDNNYSKFEFLIGKWQGTGQGFGNETSNIESEFSLIMSDKYVMVKNNSKFDPTENKPKSENHIDWGMISFDKGRKLYIYRQFNNEGYVNQFVLNNSLSSEIKLIFKTETIENFVKGGKARWTINKIKENEIETIFDVSFPGKEYSCFGVNKLKKK